MPQEESGRGESSRGCTESQLYIPLKPVSGVQRERLSGSTRGDVTYGE